MRMKLTREQRVAHRLLSSYSLMGDRIESAVDVIARADSAKTSMSSAVGSLGMSGEQKDRMLDAILRMDAGIDRLRELSGQFSSQFEEIEGLVTSVQRTDPAAGRALRQVYLKGMAAKEAAAEDECSKKTLYLQLRKGLDLAYGMLCAGGDGCEEDQDHQHV